MDAGLLNICALTFVIHLGGTLAYSVRIAGTRTRRIALSLSVFNVLVLVSRTSDDPYCRRSVVWLTGSRLVGTVLAQLIPVPAALWIVTFAEWL